VVFEPDLSIMEAVGGAYDGTGFHRGSGYVAIDCGPARSGCQASL
jgi:hypothetical protein